MRLNVRARNTIVSKHNPKVHFEYLIHALKQHAQSRCVKRLYAYNVFIVRPYGPHAKCTAHKKREKKLYTILCF